MNIRKTLFFLLLMTLAINYSIAQVKYKEKIKMNKKIVEFYEPQDFDSLSNIIEKHFKKNKNIEWKIVKNNKNVERIDKYKDDIKLEFADILITKSNNKIKSIEGVTDIKILSSSVQLLESEAIDYAKAYFGNEEFISEDETKETISLVYVPLRENGNLSNKYRIAYKINLYGIKPIRREWIYIDANNGEVLFSNPIICSRENIIDPDYPYLPPIPPPPTPTHQIGTANTYYSNVRQIETYEYNGTYYQKNLKRGNGIYVYDMQAGMNYSNVLLRTDYDNIWNSTSTVSLISNEAFWAQCLVYDYFKNEHNRKSIDNNGYALKGYYNADITQLGYGNNDNAFWDGSKMTYGMGTNITSMVALDVVAHEIGHGLNDFTSGLIYEKESGAINESLSDIWGCVIESKYAPEKSAYLIGEDLIPGGLRSMSDPIAYGYPEFYQGAYWFSTENCTPSSYNDYCGVHQNSSVVNFWFYLLSHGGSGVNEDNFEYNITGVGMDKASDIVYLAETNYLSSTSDFDDFRRFSILAANSLYGKNSFESVEVLKAWRAIGLDSYFVCYIGGPTKATNSGSYTWFANVNYGVPPYTYKWYEKYNGGNYYLVSTNSTYSSSMPYDYDMTLKLEVTDSEGNTNTSSRLIINLDASGGIVTPHPIISVAPNPVKNKKLRIIGNKDYEMDSYIIIADNTGLPLYNFQKVKIKKDNELIFDVGKLSFGTYFLKITFSNGETYSTSFIVD